MKHLIHALNKAFDHRVRLGVMVVLLAGESVSFNDLKETLELTDGNLASHVAALEKAGWSGGGMSWWLASYGLARCSRKIRGPASDWLHWLQHGRRYWQYINLLDYHFSSS